MSRSALSHAVNGFFDRWSMKPVAAQPVSRASQVRVESRYNEGDDESLLESATSLPRPTLKALEKAIRSDGFKGAQVSGWAQGQRGGFTVHYGGQQYEFEISENTTPRPMGELGRLVKESGRYSTNGRRTGILSDGTRVNVYHDDSGSGDPWTVVPHSEDWDSMEHGGMRSMLGMSEHGLGFSQWSEGQEGRHLGRSVPWDAVPDEIKQHIERRVVGEAQLSANARRKKGVTVGELPSPAGSQQLVCPECRAEFSADRSDYFQLPKNEILACEHCEVPLELRSKRLPKPSALDEGLFDDDYVLSIVDRDGAIGLFRVQRGGWRNTEPLAVGYHLDQVSEAAERDARERGVHDAVIWDAELDRQVGHVLRGRWQIEEDAPQLARNASDMNAFPEQSAFIEELQRGFDPQAADRQLYYRVRPGTLWIDYINLPSGVGSAGGGAEAQNNRMSFNVRGFPGGAERSAYAETAVPAGKVKIEQSTSFDRTRKFRAKTGSALAIARYLAEYLTDFAAEVPPRFTHTRR